MSLLEGIWSTTPFRRAVKDLLSLPSKELKSLAEATEAGFELSQDLASEYGLSKERFSLLLAALETLYVEAKEAERGTEGLVEELRTLMSQTPDEFDRTLLSQDPGLLSEVLRPRPAYDLVERRRAIQRSVLPTLDGLSLTVDLRIVENASGEASRELFPVLLARFQFDEAVQGGDTVTFQLTEEHLEELQKQIKKARELIDWSIRQLPEPRVE
jgi:hypothetical protein